MSPISYWVHCGVNEDDISYLNCIEFNPPFPKKDPLRGFPFLLVEVSGFQFEFASSLELAHCIEVLEQKNLPTTTSLSNDRGTGYGPNNHWLSRLPGKLKSWSKREKVLSALSKAKKESEARNIDF